MYNKLQGQSCNS